jgi:hypothetical protein
MPLVSKYGFGEYEPELQIYPGAQVPLSLETTPPIISGQQYLPLGQGIHEAFYASGVKPIGQGLG